MTSLLSRALTLLGTNVAATGNLAEGERLLGKALTLAEELGDEYHVGCSLSGLADTCIERRRYREAAERYSAATSCWQRIGDLVETRGVLFRLALISMRRGDRAAAVELVQDGLRRSLASGDRWGLSRGAQATLLLVNRDVDVERKARLLSAADALAETTGFSTGLLEGPFALSFAAVREQIEREGQHHAVHTERTASFEETGVLALALLEELAQTTTDATSKARKPAETRLLSPREQEVLGLLAEGLSNKEIARRLIVSVFTVKAQVVSIYNKLGVDSRAHAVAVAAERGLLYEVRGSAPRAV